MTLARTVSGMDAIFGGHSHTITCMSAPNKVDAQYQPTDECNPDRQNGTWIMQAAEWGKYVGRADFEYKDGTLTLKRYQLIPVNLKKRVTDANGDRQYVLYGQAIAEDEALQATLAAYQAQGDALLSEPVGAVQGNLDGERKDVRHKPTNLGVLIAEGMRERTFADFAIMNGGGIRASLPEGEITYRDILTVQPFGNSLVYVDLSGSGC